MNLRGILRKATIEDLQEALRYQRSFGKRAKLEGEKAALLKALQKVERSLAKLDGGSGNESVPASKPGRKPGRKRGYKLSPATRNRMRIAALKRFGNKTKVAEAPKPERKTRKLSAAGRAAISAAAKARWERIRQAKAEPKAEAKAE